METTLVTNKIKAATNFDIYKLINLNDSSNFILNFWDNWPKIGVNQVIRSLLLGLEYAVGFFIRGLNILIGFA